MLHADAVVVGVGMTPAVEWLEGSGIELDDGIVTDAGCRTETPRSDQHDVKFQSVGYAPHWDELEIEDGPEPGSFIARYRAGDRLVAAFGGRAGESHRTRAQGDPGERQTGGAGMSPRVSVDEDVCIGSGTCVQIAAGVFELDDEGVAQVVDPTAAVLAGAGARRDLVSRRSDQRRRRIANGSKEAPDGRHRRHRVKASARSR